MGFENLTPEQQEKTRACKTSEELIELARSEGVEISGEQLEAVAGGLWGLKCHGLCEKDASPYC